MICIVSSLTVTHQQVHRAANGQNVVNYATLWCAWWRAL